MSTKLLAGVAALALCPVSAMAIGLDRSAQNIDVLFEDGNYFELSFGRVLPSIDGNDVALFGGGSTGEVADDYSQLSAGVKFQFNDQLSFALIGSEPYGADIAYPTAAAGGSVALGGTAANVGSDELIALARYEFTDNFSVHGGLRYTKLDANVTLQGAAYGALSGYNADFSEDGDIGGVVGVAYERPEIALRVALTYFQGTEHDLATTETYSAALQGALGLPGTTFNSVTKVKTPDAVNLDFQTGLNQQTLLFGQIRYAWYDDVIVSPTVFDAASEPTVPGSSITDIDDSWSLSLGVGRKLTDRLSGSVTFGYEPEGDSDLVSPLAPTNGQKSIGVGLSYAVNDQMTIAGGVRYISLGDAFAETGTPDEARASFSGNDVVGIGVQIGYKF